ncbi:hypothetical protein I7I48_06731 [Histoplasma ohiense]|nr:hypothetical protein I7I48_06731 [Histoplasma ohiense (nom. inval.)]
MSPCSPLQLLWIKSHLPARGYLPARIGMYSTVTAGPRHHNKSTWFPPMTLKGCTCNVHVRTWV